MEGKYGWRKANIKMQVVRPTTWKRTEPRSTAPRTETLPDLENIREVPSKMQGKSSWRKANIKMQVARPTTWKRREPKVSAQETETPASWESSREVSAKMEDKSSWRKANIKMRVVRPTTWKRREPKESVQETETSAGWESSREVSAKMEGKSSWRKANIKMQVARPTTWKGREPKVSAQETETPAGWESSREVSAKMEDKSSWRKANIKMRVVRPTTWKRREPKESVQETETPSGLEGSRKIAAKVEGKSSQQKDNITMQVARPTTWKRAETSSTQETKPPSHFPRSKRNWRNSSIWVTNPTLWKRQDPKDSAQQKPRSISTQENEIFSDLESFRKVTAKIKGRKAWRKIRIKMQVIKAIKASSIIGEGDEGKSQFVLENLEHYTIHPNLAQYYETVKVSDEQKLFKGKQKIKRFMSQVTEFDQNKTLLIMTNNPPPSPVNWQGKDKPPRYFSQELLFKPQGQQKTTSHIGLPLMKKKKLKAEPRTPFPVVILEDAKPKQEQWYRFSTKADFKGKATFSKLHALKKQEETYPQLSFVPDLRAVARELASRQKVSMVSWEPLTLATLLEEKPTLTLPLQGDSPLRYGRAPQWFINTTTVPN